MEKELQKQCNEFLKRIDAWYYHRENAGGTKRSHSAGLPDLLFAIKGKFFAFELKQKGGIVSQKQKEVLTKMHEAGFITRIIYSFDSFIDILREYNIIK